jgi:hypothetical protein
MTNRTEFFSRIRANIDSNGYHVTLVSSACLPRYAYTIGCKEIFGSELIFAGGEYYSKSDISTIIDQIIIELKKTSADWQSISLSIDSLGSFSLSKVDQSWSKLLALGVFDFYDQEEIQTLQILPDQEHRTFDIPDMSIEFNVASQPVWQWLIREWDYPIPSNSTAVTNLKVLYGEKATEVMRWEAGEWEIFSGAGPDVPKKDMRVVPLAILIGIDKSLEPVIHLEIGKGFWRDSNELVWNNWG